MAVVITSAEVIAYYPPAASLPTQTVTDTIAIVDQADACLDAKGVIDAQQRQLKLAACALLLIPVANQGGSGLLKSVTDFEGASETYANESGFYGNESKYLSMIKNSGYASCFPFVAQNRARFLVAT